MKFPKTRKRRLRQSNAIRQLSAENHLHASDLILPVFVLDGKDRREAISSMPGVYRLSIDLLIEKLIPLHNKGLNAVALFPVIHADLKSLNAEHAWHSDGLVQRCVKQIKLQMPELCLITDVALDPYTSHGQDGLLDENGNIVNDETVAALVKQACSHAEAGADVVAPSDMMDGRIGQIREALEENGHQQTVVLSYAAKYASCFYGPFREAVGSAKNLGSGSKETYQMNPANAREALDEIALDIAEGADMVMVKPGLPYLDIIRQARDAFNVPLAAYQVSGEYAMLQTAIDKNYLTEKAAILESLLCFKRAGCDAILTYFADRVIEWLDE